MSDGWAMEFDPRGADAEMGRGSAQRRGQLVAEVIDRAGLPSLPHQPRPGHLSAELDQVAVSPSDVWMIDTKEWAGDVTLHHGVLREDGLNRSANVLRVRAEASDVASRMGSGAPDVIPVVCLTRSGSDLHADIVDGVVVVGLEHLAEVLGAGSDPRSTHDRTPQPPVELVDRVNAALQNDVHPGRRVEPLPPPRAGTRPAPGPSRWIWLLVLLVLAALMVWAVLSSEAVRRMVSP